MRRALIGTSLAALLLTGGIMPAGAWDRGDTEIFAILPDLPGGPVAKRRADGRPGRHGLHAILWHQQPGRGPWPAAFVLLQTERPAALRCRAGQSGASAPAQHPPARTGVSEIFPDIADLRPFQRHCVAGESENGQSNRVHADTGQGSNSGLNALTFDKAGNVYVSDSLSGRHLEDRLKRRGTPSTVRQLSDTVAAGRRRE